MEWPGKNARDAISISIPRAESAKCNSSRGRPNRIFRRIRTSVARIRQMRARRIEKLGRTVFPREPRDPGEVTKFRRMRARSAVVQIPASLLPAREKAS